MSGSAHPSNVLQLFTDPSAEGPKMAFGNGQVANNQPALLPSSPSISGSTSNWDVIEWAKSEYLQPAAMQVDNPATYDLLYGNAAYSWSTNDKESALRAYQRADGSWVYDLIGSGGTLTAGGGANLFLSAKASVIANFASPITYRVDARITQADVEYFDPGAAATGAVLAQAFTGFVATFNAPSTAAYDPKLPTWTAFIQIPISNSGANPAGGLYDKVQKSSKGGGTITYSHLLPGESALAYQADTGPLHPLSYNLNAHLSDLIAQSGLGTAEQDMSKWTLSSMYIGLETETASAIQNAAAQPEGSLAVGLELADISVSQDTSQTYTYAPAVPASNAGGVKVISPVASSLTSSVPTTSAPPVSVSPATTGSPAASSSGTATATPQVASGGSTASVQGQSEPKSALVAPSGGQPPNPAASTASSLTISARTTSAPPVSVSPATTGSPAASSSGTATATPQVASGGSTASVQGQSEPKSALVAPSGGQPPNPAASNVGTRSHGDFLVQDLTTGQTSTAGGTVTGSTDVFTELAPDNLVITALVPNAVIQSGAGNDILVAQSGHNILESNGGAINFLFSGTGTDTLFLSPQSVPVTWNTLVNFHAGDVAVLWDITPQTFQFSVADGQGVPAYSGLTLHEMAPGRAAFLTLAGYTSADLSNGKLVVAFGTDAATGSSYMLVTAAH